MDFLLLIDTENIPLWRRNHTDSSNMYMPSLKSDHKSWWLQRVKYHYLPSWQTLRVLHIITTTAEMQLSSWCDSQGPLRFPCWVIQAGVCHWFTLCRSHRGDSVCHINTGMTLFPSGFPPASHKHITAWPTNTWPVSLNTSNTCTHTELNQSFTGIQRSVGTVEILI